MWVDVRVPYAVHGAALAVLAEKFAPVTIRLDMEPPASGPEVELSVYDVNEADLAAVLRDAGIAVFASRTRPPELAVAA